MDKLRHGQVRKAGLIKTSARVGVERRSGARIHDESAQEVVHSKHGLPPHSDRDQRPRMPSPSRSSSYIS